MSSSSSIEDNCGNLLILLQEIPHYSPTFVDPTRSQTELIEIIGINTIQSDLIHEIVKLQNSFLSLQMK